MQSPKLLQQHNTPAAIARYASNNNSSEDSDDTNCHPGNKKRPKLAVRPCHLRKHKQSLTCGSADNNDDKYEVEGILDARINRRKLQYRLIFA
jgi:hypothetical protein